MSSTYQQVWLLALVNAIAQSGMPMILLIGSIIGAELAPSTSWATLPITLSIIGTACGVLPATRGMARYGRKSCFALFISIGLLACLLASQAMAWADFSLFCLAAALIGFANAALQQIRFAAMESVDPDSGPAAASIIMCAGIVAAFLGPELALAGRDIDPVPYRGSFWLGACCYLAAGCLLYFYQPVSYKQQATNHSGRSYRSMLSNRLLLLAIVSGAVAYIVMSFVMTATPVSMHIHHGHSLEDTKWVIQSHIAAMFLPSLITAWLFRRLSIRSVMLAGLLCYCGMIVTGLLNLSVLGFWGQLVMLGIGWNFLFVSGTVLLPSTYREGEQFRAQALNDSVVFSTQAIASLSAGWALNLISWQSVLLLCLIPMGLLIAALYGTRKDANWHRDSALE